MSRLVLAIVVAVGAVGCAHEYAYRPAVPGAGNDAAVRYPIPPEAPHGDVYVTSFGFTQMDVAQGQTADMIHARLVAVNNGGDVWTVDGRAQQLELSPGQPPPVAPTNTPISRRCRARATTRRCAIRSRPRRRRARST